MTLSSATRHAIRPELVLALLLGSAAPLFAQNQPSPRNPSPADSLREAQKAFLDRSIVRVGKKEFTGHDLRAEVNRIIPLTFFHARLPESKRAETSRQALESLIERELIYQDAVSRGLTASDEEIRSVFHETLEKAGPDFKDVGASKFEELLDRFRPQVIRRVLIDKNEARFASTLPKVEDRELRELYEERKDEFLAPEVARFRHILLKVEPSASSAEAREIRQTLVDIKERIDQGEDFGALAREYSEDIYAPNGGDMGFVARGSFQDRALEVAAFALEDGETSEVISTLYGFHLLRREGTQPRKQLSFEEAEPTLRAEREEKIRDQARKAWLDGLRERIGVEYLVDPKDLY